ncbi:MAG: DUF309 domain-containing protein [Nitrospira sp.]
MAIEPTPPDPNGPRYSTQPFPSYRFAPGLAPHPRRDPSGHSYGKPERKPTRFAVDEWQTSEDYLYGIDLYNFAYWWECHEVFEGLWHAFGHNSEQGNLFQALIQFAASNLKWSLGNETAARKLARNGLDRLQKVPSPYMGIDVTAFTERYKTTASEGSEFRPALLTLLTCDSSQKPG